MPKNPFDEIDQFFTQRAALVGTSKVRYGSRYFRRRLNAWIDFLASSIVPEEKKVSDVINALKAAEKKFRKLIGRNQYANALSTLLKHCHTLGSDDALTALRRQAKSRLICYRAWAEFYDALETEKTQAAYQALSAYHEAKEDIRADALPSLDTIIEIASRVLPTTKSLLQTMTQELKDLQERLRLPLVVGNKSANLIRLNKLIQANSQMQLPFRVRVPELEPLTNDRVMSHLDKHAKHWRELWHKFTQQQSEEQVDLSSAAKATTEQLRQLILDTFSQYPFSSSELEKYLGGLPRDSLLMIRSTGKEDTAALANPGGNESVAAVAPSEKAISNAIGIVVASYFSEKSLKQRLISGDDIATFPFMPVLINRMIGEPLSGTKNPAAVIKSGVMYANSTGVCIQVAPGHGELIVNSKAPFDTFLVTQENIVHAEIYRKSHRLVPIEQEEKGRWVRKLALKQNHQQLTNQPSVSSEIALAIAKVGRLIKKEYGTPMDIEFVYEPTDNTLYLVQARPIPKGDLKLVVPSSIAPEKLPAIKQKGEIKEAFVITSAGDAARVITQPEEILICDTIGQALPQYLDQKESPVKTVIVNEVAPTTSHEAAQFTAKAIPVLAIENTNIIREWSRQPRLVMIIDPQRKQIINWSSQIKNHGQAEEELYREGYLVTGLFKSPTPSQVTLLPFWQNKKWIPSEKVAQSPKIALGDLIQRVNSPDEITSQEAMNQLMMELFSLFPNYPIPALPKNRLYSFLREQIEIVESAKPRELNQEKITQALHTILVVFYQLAKTEKAQDYKAPFTQLLRHATITVAEIFRCLERLSTADSELKAKDIQQEFLMLVAKLEGLIINPGQKNLISNSLRQIAQQNKSILKAAEMKGFEEALTSTQQSYYVEFIKLGKLALNQRLAAEWARFAFECCQDPKKTLQLAHLVKFNMTDYIASDWLNNSFARAFHDNKASTVILEAMQAEADITQQTLQKLKINEKKGKLQQWEQLISQWSHQKKFQNLWGAYLPEVTDLIKELNMTPDLPPLAKIAVIRMVQELTEIMDRSIKALKSSPAYDTKLQVQRFAMMLDPYHTLMQKWVEFIPEKQFDAWSINVDALPESNKKNNMINAITERFENLKKAVSRSSKPLTKELNPSGVFSVATARVGSTASFHREFIHKATTLEDLFTLFHQNILASTAYLSTDSNMELSSLPDTLQPLLAALLKVRISEDNVIAKLMSIEQHFPILTVTLNLPLRNHAAQFILEYNQLTHKSLLQARYFGHNIDGRMNLICTAARLDAHFCGITVKHQPVYSTQSRLLEFSWELTEEQTKQLALSASIKNALSLYARITFTPTYSPNNSIDNYSTEQFLEGWKALPQAQKNNFTEAFVILKCLGSPDVMSCFTKEEIMTHVTMSKINDQCGKLDHQKLQMLINLGMKIEWDALQDDKTFLEALIYYNKNMTAMDFFNLIKTHHIDLNQHPNIFEFAVTNNKAELPDLLRTENIVLKNQNLNFATVLNHFSNPTLKPNYITAFANGAKLESQFESELLRNYTFVTLAELLIELDRHHINIDLSKFNYYQRVQPMLVSLVISSFESTQDAKQLVQVSKLPYLDPAKNPRFLQAILDKRNTALLSILAEHEIILTHQVIDIDIFMTYFDNPKYKKYCEKIIASGVDARFTVAKKNDRYNYASFMELMRLFAQHKATVNFEHSIEGYTALEYLMMFYPNKSDILEIIQLFNIDTLKHDRLYRIALNQQHEGALQGMSMFKGQLVDFASLVAIYDNAKLKRCCLEAMKNKSITVRLDGMLNDESLTKIPAFKEFFPYISIAHKASLLSHQYNNSALIDIMIDDPGLPSIMDEVYSGTWRTIADKYPDTLKKIISSPYFNMSKTLLENFTKSSSINAFEMILDQKPNIVNDVATDIIKKLNPNDSKSLRRLLKHANFVCPEEYRELLTKETENQQKRLTP